MKYHIRKYPATERNTRGWVVDMERPDGDRRVYRDPDGHWLWNTKASAENARREAIESGATFGPRIAKGERA